MRRPNTHPLLAGRRRRAAASGEMAAVALRLGACHGAHLDRRRLLDGPVWRPVAIEICPEEALNGAADRAMPAAADLDFHSSDDLRLYVQHRGELPDREPERSSGFAELCRRQGLASSAASRATPVGSIRARPAPRARHPRTGCDVPNGSSHRATGERFWNSGPCRGGTRSAPATGDGAGAARRKIDRDQPRRCAKF